MLAVAHLTRTFGDRTAVHGVSFELQPGEIFGLLGPNGGGKTTTLRMLAGLIRPSEGEVRLDGTPVCLAMEIGCVKLKFQIENFRLKIESD
jgi:ABC-2 type transport system ATP-binding protein